MATVRATGRAIRRHDGYGPYHAAATYPNGDMTVLCGWTYLLYAPQEHPHGFGSLTTGRYDVSVCMDCARLWFEPHVEDEKED